MGADWNEAAHWVLIPASSDHWSLDSNLSLNVIFVCSLFQFAYVVCIVVFFGAG